MNQAINQPSGHQSSGKKKSARLSKSKPDKKKSRATAPARQTSSKAHSTVLSWLQLAQLRSEKCELVEARVAYSMALQQAKKVSDLRSIMEALSGLLRLAGEALDSDGMVTWETELDRWMQAHPRQIPAMAWYCKGAIARHQKLPRMAQRYFHRYLRAVRLESPDSYAGTRMTHEEAIARGWIMLAITLWQRGRNQRAVWLAEEVLKRFGATEIKGIQGFAFLLLGNVAERQRQFEDAMRWYQKAHSTFLAEHNWYYHLYVLYGYARIARMQQNYSQAYWYLELVDRAASGPEFGLLRREIEGERNRLQKDAVDLLIDSRKAEVQTREAGTISLKKQYVLLHILEALSQAHGIEGEDSERGLSKAEIIEKVWKENYRPEAHDNKLYYNINRLRKLLEPDVRKPQYLLNWKEGYRLAPGLRVRLLNS